MNNASRGFRDVTGYVQLITSRGEEEHKGEKGSRRAEHQSCLMLHAGRQYVIVLPIHTEETTKERKSVIRHFTGCLSYSLRVRVMIQWFRFESRCTTFTDALLLQLGAQFEQESKNTAIDILVVSFLINVSIERHIDHRTEIIVSTPPSICFCVRFTCPTYVYVFWAFRVF